MVPYHATRRKTHTMYLYKPKFLLDFGAKPLASDCAQMNRESSRSHLIMSIVIESTNLQTQNVTKGKLSFVDLAGSER